MATNIIQAPPGGIYDTLNEAVSYAQTYRSIAVDILCSEEFLDEKDPNDPASATQRAHAALHAMEAELERIRVGVDGLRAMSRESEASHG
jgi:hypothetical protein